MRKRMKSGKSTLFRTLLEHTEQLAKKDLPPTMRTVMDAWCEKAEGLMKLKQGQREDVLKEMARMVPIL